ncbi:Sucrose-6-phosphate hydrolase [Kluyvera cryocrescens]|uniref:Sucrose-6-phosphate hydrolase n=1 Tax=Kluyvera cryocrescens TaxID=580 RepID=A0A485D3K1_KLUCR|nr:Sucrose-6-phosphate hydrolase [Kluyvera cryocrescens]
MPAGSAWPDPVWPATRSIIVTGAETFRSLHIFIDQSSVEIFINGGEGVMSCRYFPACSGQLMFSGITPDAFCYWPLRTCMVE